MKKIIALFFSITISVLLYAQKLKTKTTQSWQNSSWQNLIRLTNNYDGNGYLINDQYESWDANTGSWSSDGRTDYTNNPDGTMKESASRQYKLTYTYTNNKVKTVVAYTWENNTWKNWYKETYTYDGNGYLINNLYEGWNNSSNSWVNSQLISYINNTNGLVQHYNVQLWESTSNSWKNNSKTIYTYMGNIKKKGVFQTWVNNAWKDNIQTTYTYENNNYLTSELSKFWNDVTNSWENSTQKTYNSNSDGTVKQFISQTWSSTSNSWENSTKEVYAYINITSIEEPTVFSFSVFPNPSSDKLTVELSDRTEAGYTITDMQGKIVLTGKLRGSIDISSLTPNLYFITTRNNKGQQTIKFVKE